MEQPCPGRTDADEEGKRVASNSVLIDKLLTTVIQLKASDIHISVGQPPVIRLHGRMRKLDAKVLDSDDTLFAGVRSRRETNHKVTKNTQKSQVPWTARLS